MSAEESTPPIIQPELLDPRVISKKTDPTGRAETAQAILQNKADKRVSQANIQEKQAQTNQLTEAIGVSFKQEDEKKALLAKRTEALIVKLKNIVGMDDGQLTDLQIELTNILGERDQLYQQRSDLSTELQDLQKDQTHKPSARELLDAYYEKVASTPLTQEQKRNLLKPEALAQLSTEQYIALWKRLNPHFLSHVTRQGFRDHNSMIYHSGGMEEFHEGFTEIMQDERTLRPPMALELKKRDETSVKEWMGDYVLGEENAEEARKKLKMLMNFSFVETPRYPDKTAVHLAAQRVLNEYYGGEKANEIFFVYPADVLASQHDFTFNGWEKDFTKPQSEDKWNDIFMWPSTVENPGIAIDAGIAFLPKNMLVDSQTGSKYASKMETVDGKEQRVMVDDTELIAKFTNFLTGLANENAPIRQAFKAAYIDKSHYETGNILRKQLANVIYQELIELGISADAIPALENLLTGMMVLHRLRLEETFSNKELLNSYVEDAKKTSAFFKRAEGTVTAEEYWEKVFAEQPNLKPKHVVYYDGDPSQAVLEFQRQHGIGRADTSGKDGRLLGFDDHHVKDMSNDPRANRGKEELLAIADKIITEHYQTRTSETNEGPGQPHLDRINESVQNAYTGSTN